MTDHYRIVLAYDGTDFAGWQSQSASRPPVGREPELHPAGTHGPRTVQGVLEDALRRLAGGERIAVSGAGRTDAGVHAEGQVASFALPRPWEPERLQGALNARLPEDVRVLEAARCAEGFHARKSARSKHYRYLLDTGAVQRPTRRRFAGHVPWSLDPLSVGEAAALFRGRRDFAALASSGSSVKTTIRTVTHSQARFEGACLVYDVEADGFLRKMVRSMVGGLIAAGRGATTVDALRAALEAGGRRDWPAPAAARGLTLVRVDYAPEIT